MTSSDDLLESDYNNSIILSNTNSQEDICEDSNKLPTARSRADSGALLDMLAEVASQKLLFSPMKRKSGYDLRKTESESSLSVSQVKSLSTNQLIKLFSTTEFDEIKKLYSFQCSFDQSCSAKFISFGNECRAKEKFKKHLLLHLETLKLNETKSVRKAVKKKKGGFNIKKKGVEVLKPEIEDEFSDDDKFLKRPKLNWDEQFMLADLNLVTETNSKVS